MKTKTGFVSNSSSSSFIIKKKHLTNEQIRCIWDHVNEAKRRDMWNSWDDAWSITESKKKIKGSVLMDNFSMDEFLRAIGVPMKKIKWNY